MISNVKITHSSLIQPKEFNSFGQINVICGKNNSGKSLFLSYLFGSEIKFGKEIDPTEVATEISNFFPEPTREDLQFRISDYLQKILQINKILIFEDQIHEYINKFPESIVLGGVSIWRNYVLSGYSILFESLKNENKRFLIPAKRQVNPEIPANSDVDPYREPHNIIPHLFFLRNCRPESQEKNNYSEIQRRFYEISDGIEFDIFMQPRNNVVSLQFKKDGVWLKAQDCGLGLQDLLLIIFFCVSEKCNVVGIEEPENHIHPEVQRKLLKFMKETGKQYFIATHSSVFLDKKSMMLFSCQNETKALKLSQYQQKLNCYPILATQ